MPVCDVRGPSFGSMLIGLLLGFVVVTAALWYFFSLGQE
jgi:Tfp pilus assembly protein PilW